MRKLICLLLLSLLFSSCETKEEKLIKAANTGDLKKIEKLIDSGANVYYKNSSGDTFITILAANNQWDIVRSVLQKVYGEKFDTENAVKNIKYINKIKIANLDNIAQLMQEKMSDSVLKTVMICGGDVNGQNNDGRTALMEARSKEIVKELIKAGADISAKDKDGDNALIRAASLGRTEVVQELLNTKIDANERNNIGYTALIAAIVYEHFDTACELIKANIIDINIGDSDGITALMWAAQRKSVDTVKEIVKVNTIDINLKGKQGETALMWAAGNGSSEIVHELVKVKGIDINAKNANGKSALINSLPFYDNYYGRYYNETMETLINAGADINQIYDYFKKFEMLQIPGSDFEMLKTEVTQQMYKAVMGENPSEYENDDYSNPVECVNWYDAIEFCNRLSSILGLKPVYTKSMYSNAVTIDKSAGGYRLPTEVEWEYAARGGEDYKFAGSNNIDDVAWYSGNSGYKSHPVAQKKPNGYGLFDMSGNVFEWCWESPSPSGRCARGGSWYNESSKSQVDFSRFFHDKYRDPSLGFRIVRSKK